MIASAVTIFPQNVWLYRNAEYMPLLLFSRAISNNSEVFCIGNIQGVCGLRWVLVKTEPNDACVIKGFL